MVTRIVTQREFETEAVTRFGDPLKVAFVCPSCGDVATIGDFPPEYRHRIGQDCIGRITGALDTPPTNTRGCPHTACGPLVSGPWTVVTTDGKRIHCFPLAPSPRLDFDAAWDAAHAEAGEH